MGDTLSRRQPGDPPFEHDHDETDEHRAYHRMRGEIGELRRDRNRLADRVTALEAENRKLRQQLERPWWRREKPK